jgi:hypothetical protein
MSGCRCESEDNQPVVIAVDDPHDLKRIDEIKALFPGRRHVLCEP